LFENKCSIQLNVTTIYEWAFEEKIFFQNSHFFSNLSLRFASIFLFNNINTEVMKTKQMNRINMYLAVKAYLLTKLSVLAALPNFTDIFNAFLAFLAAIQSAIEKQSFDKKGVTKTKKALKLNLALIAGDIGRKIYAYALHIKDQVLLSEVTISQSELKTKSDEPLKETAEGIYNRAALHLADLTPYGITAATQLELRNAIDNFAAAMTNPRLSDTEAKELTHELEEDFKGAENELKELKAIMEIIRIPEPAIYRSFIQACRIIPYGEQSYAVRGLVTDSITKIGITGVSITFLHEDGTNLQPPLVKKSAAKGGFNVKSLAEGVYKIKLTKVGYAEQLITITVNGDELCRINVEMVGK